MFYVAAHQDAKSLARTWVVPGIRGARYISFFVVEAFTQAPKYLPLCVSTPLGCHFWNNLFPFVFADIKKNFLIYFHLKIALLKIDKIHLFSAYVSFFFISSLHSSFLHSLYQLRYPRWDPNTVTGIYSNISLYSLQDSISFLQACGLCVKN